MEFYHRNWKETAPAARRVAALLLAWCALWCAGAAGGEMVRRFEFSANGADTKSYGYVPVFLDIDNDEAQVLRLNIRSGNSGGQIFEFNQRLQMPENTRVRLEVPVPVSSGYYHVRLRRDTGSEFTDSLNYPSIYYRSSPLIELWSVNSFLFSQLKDYAAQNAKGAVNVEVTPRQVEDLPTRWQSYAGVAAIPLLSVRDIVRLSAPQRRALSDWVRWGGGRLWLVGTTHAEARTAAQKDFGLPCPAAQDATARVGIYPLLMGEVWACAEKDLLQWGNLAFRQMPGIVPEFRTDSLSYFNGGGLLDNLGGLSAGVIALILAALGLLLGPVNYLYIRRSGSLLLFYLTTPLLALLGVGLVAGYSIFHEGFSAKYKEAALLLHETGTERGAVFLARGIYSGLGMGELVYPSDALLYPFRQNSREGTIFSAELGGDIRLTGGWVTPRTPSGILSITPQAVRMGVAVTQEGGKYYALNTLDHPVRSLAYWVANSDYAVTENLPPGERRELRLEKNRQRMNELLKQTGQFFPALRFTNFRLLAECEGLPYLDAGNPGGTKELGRYFYASSLSQSAQESGRKAAEMEGGE